VASLSEQAAALQRAAAAAQAAAREAALAAQQQVSPVRVLSASHPITWALPPDIP
jgi:hypothetical protein